MTRCECGAEPGNKDVGYEIREVYDGILVWRCWSCDRFRPRFASGRLHGAALAVLARWEENG